MSPKSLTEIKDWKTNLGGLVLIPLSNYIEAKGADTLRSTSTSEGIRANIADDILKISGIII